MNEDIYPGFDPNNYPLEDPHPDLSLEKINPHSLRAWTLLIRSKDKEIVRKHFVSIAGAIDIMRGLEYHHENFCRIVTELGLIPLLTSLEKKKRLCLVHETVAYLNRLGQFYYFASSKFVRITVPQWKNTIPTIIKFKRFRDKHSAHRSLDAPKPEDGPFHQQVHAWAISSVGGTLSHPKPGKTPPESLSDFLNPNKMWIESYVLFQLVGDGKHDTLNLSIEREHPFFMNEAYALISTMLSKSSKGGSSGG